MLCYVAYTADKSSIIYPLQQLDGNTPNFFFSVFCKLSKDFLHIEVETKWKLQIC